MKPKEFNDKIDALRSQLAQLEKDEQGHRYHRHVTSLQKEMLAYLDKLQAEHTKSPKETEKKFAALTNSFDKFQTTLESLKEYNKVKHNPSEDIKAKARDKLINAATELDQSVTHSIPQKIAIGLRTFAGFALGAVIGTVMALPLIAVGILAATKEKNFSDAPATLLSKALLAPFVYMALNTHFAYDYGKRKQKEVDFDILPTDTESNPTNVFKRVMQINRAEAIEEKLKKAETTKEKSQAQEIELAPISSPRV